MPPTKRATHLLESGIAVVPAFIIKLWKLVEDPSSNHLISWSAAETSFIIKNQADFAKELLPHYFKHSNLASFIRQLNFYGFRKVSSIEGRSLQHDKNETEFFHPFFIRQQKGLLCLIKRKVAKGEDAIVIPDVQDLLTDVKVLQGKQDTVDSLLSEMKQENQILWQEIAQLREKHAKQQRIVAKLIHFLATLVQPKGGNLSLKRKTPLMIDVRKPPLSSEQRISAGKKLKQDICLSTKTNYCNVAAKLNYIRDKENNDLTIHDVASDTDTVPCSSASQTDFVIVESPLSEITDNGNIDSSCIAMNLLEPLTLLEPLQPNSNNFCLSDDVLGLPEKNQSLDESDSKDQNRPADTSVPTTLQQPKMPEASWNVEVTEDSNLGNRNLSSVNSDIQLSEADSITKVALNEHLQYMGNELDWLHEQLSQERLDIDASDILKLFTADNDSTPDNSLPLLDIFPSHKSPDGIVGSEMLPHLSPPLDFSILGDPLDDVVSSVGTSSTVENDPID